MAGPTSLIASVQLFQVLKEIDLLQLYEQYLASHERGLISLPDKNHSRSLSLHLFKVISEFYHAFLCDTPSVPNCSFYLECHDRNYLCLPDYFEESPIEMLAAMLRWQQVPYFSLVDLVPFVRLCGYLMIKTEAVHAFSICLLPLSLYAVDSSDSVHIFVCKLHSYRFFGTAEYFSCFVDPRAFFAYSSSTPVIITYKANFVAFIATGTLQNQNPTDLCLHFGELKEGRRELTF